MVFRFPLPVAGAALFLAVACALAGCRSPEQERLARTTIPTYDDQSGKLTALTYDWNHNGRIDTWTDMDGSRPLRSRIDLDEDGQIDRWEYYDAQGKLAKVGFSRRRNGKPDAWAYPSGDGSIVRVDVSSTSDEHRIDRWERYDGSARAEDGGAAPGTIVSAEEDTNADGRADEWETYAQGVLRTVSFDENHDGAPDRRLTYDAGTLVRIETQPDGHGRFKHAVDVK
jgi:hypothetical protein